MNISDKINNILKRISNWEGSDELIDELALLSDIETAQYEWE